MQKNFRLLFLVCIVVLSLRGQAQTPLALTHVTVIDGTGARPQTDQTVLVVGERIAAIGKSGTVKLPEGTRTVDATGKTLIPGLWDMHVHGTGILRFSELYIANGVTGIRDMFSASLPYIQAERKAIAGGRPGPRIVAAGRIVDGPKPIWPGSVTAKDAEEGRKAVATVKREGSDFVKVYSLLPRDAYFAIVEESRRQSMVFAGHVPESVSALEASNAGQKSIEHLTGVLQACSAKEDELRHLDPALSPAERSRIRTPLLLENYDAKKAAALFARFRHNRTWQCPTLVVLRNIAFLNDPALAQDARTKYLPSYAMASWNPKNDFRFKDAPPNYWANAQKLYARNKQLVGAMRRAGVEFLAGTDTLNPYCFPGFSLHDELALLVEAGLTPMEALQAATRNPARYLGLDRACGTVQPGKAADLVLLDADPLQDIHNTTRIRGVVRAGKWFDRAALDALLNEAATAADHKPAKGDGAGKK